ncbi:hypothetical protein MRB53_030075 [Persea americana]|uniref:Uncharacterized protein n=1 Tax=Persea americana TaxID=3435 RepID=A0ACC2KKG7_PERAE|nr:hypothetical protein MRB53_030075 [Persea americana]
MRGRRGRAQAAAPGESSLQITYEEFQPSSDWTHDSINHVLLVDLPGFKKEDLKVQVDLGKLTISGERREGEGRYRRFKQVFDVPSDSIIEKISGKFEHGLLFVIMPLKEVDEKPKPTQKEEPKKEDAAIGKESPKKEEKPTQKEEPKKEDAAIGKESLKKEEKPTQKQEPKKEDAAIGKESLKKEEKPTQKQEPKNEDAAIGKESTKKEEKPTDKEEEKEKPKREDGAMGKDGTKKEEKPMQKLKEEAKKEDGVRTNKIEAEGDKHVQRDKKERGFVDSSSIKKQEERGWGRRKEEREAMAMAMEGEEVDEDSERDLFQTVVEQINKNKAVIVVAALAFSFGVYLSRKLR